MPFPFLALRLGDLARAAGLRAGDLARGLRAGEAARAPPADWRRVATMRASRRRRVQQLNLLLGQSCMRRRAALQL